MLLPQRGYDHFEESKGFSLSRYSIMMCMAGSQVHGTDNADSDEDYFGVVVPPTMNILGLTQFDRWRYPEDSDLDASVFSLRKYVGLLLKNNPTMLETLWLREEDYCPRATTHSFRRLVENRNAFSSLRAYPAFSGYAYNQLSRMERGVTSGRMGAKRKKNVKKFGYDTKNASHLLRLYRMGIEFVETGQLNVFRTHDKEELLAIKNGEWDLNDVKAEAELLHERMKDAKEMSPLPKEPDMEAIDKLLVDISMHHLLHNESFRRKGV